MNFEHAAAEVRPQVVRWLFVSGLGFTLFYTVAALEGIYDRRALQVTLLWAVGCAWLRPQPRALLPTCFSVLLLSGSHIIITPPAALLLLTCTALGLRFAKHARSW